MISDVIDLYKAPEEFKIGNQEARQKRYEEIA